MRFSEFKPLKESIGPLSVPTPGPNQSDNIVALQKTLASLKYDVHPTGILDDRTTQAIASAQSNYGLPITGNADNMFISTVNGIIHSIPGMADFISGLFRDVTNTIMPSDSPSDTKPKSMPSAASATKPTASAAPAPSQVDKEIKPLSTSKSPLASDPKFLAKVKEVADKLQIDPNVLMKVMQHESHLDPHVRNSRGYVGLIQFGDEAAATVGVPKAKIRQMDAISQMDLVYAYYKAVGVTPNMSEGEIYMLTFLPWAKKRSNNEILGHKNNPNHLGNTKIVKGNLWDANPPFANWAASKGRDYFTKGDVIDYFKHYKA